jgi:dihydrodipicolinate synthase/N-acetylneuraminate lyase
MQPEQQLSGVYVILCTPFDERGNLDEASLQREVQFCVAAGVQGVVVSATASEVWTLTDEERRHITRLVLAELNGKLPTVVGVTAGSAQAAEKFARDAAAAGASAIMAAPPAGRPLPRPRSTTIIARSRARSRSRSLYRTATRPAVCA